MCMCMCTTRYTPATFEAARHAGRWPMSLPPSPPRPTSSSGLCHQTRCRPDEYASPSETVANGRQRSPTVASACHVHVHNEVHARHLRSRAARRPLADVTAVVATTPDLVQRPVPPNTLPAERIRQPIANGRQRSPTVANGRMCMCMCTTRYTPATFEATVDKYYGWPMSLPPSPPRPTSSSGLCHQTRCRPNEYAATAQLANGRQRSHHVHVHNEVHARHLRSRAARRPLADVTAAVATTPDLVQRPVPPNTLPAGRIRQPIANGRQRSPTVANGRMCMCMCTTSRAARRPLADVTAAVATTPDLVQRPVPPNTLPAERIRQPIANGRQRSPTVANGRICMCTTRYTPATFEAARHAGRWPMSLPPSPPRPTSSSGLCHQTRCRPNEYASPSPHANGRQRSPTVANGRICMCTTRYTPATFEAARHAGRWPMSLPPSPPRPTSSSGLCHQTRCRPDEYASPSPTVANGRQRSHVHVHVHNEVHARHLRSRAARRPLADVTAAVATTPDLVQRPVPPNTLPAERIRQPIDRNGRQRSPTVANGRMCMCTTRYTPATFEAARHAGRWPMSLPPSPPRPTSSSGLCHQTRWTGGGRATNTLKRTAVRP
uniref:Uncharacterized protein n=1 Tax=Phytophthora ramorum TaxID=164328 RepID=H3GIX9_PHYRM